MDEQVNKVYERDEDTNICLVELMMSTNLAIQNESQSVFMFRGHFGEERALSKEDESKKSVVETKGKDEMEADNRQGWIAIIGPRKPKRQEGKDEEGSPVEN